MTSRSRVAFLSIVAEMDGFGSGGAAPALLRLIVIFYISCSITAGNRKRSTLSFSVKQAVEFDAVVCRSILAGAKIVAQPNL